MLFVSVPPQNDRNLQIAGQLSTTTFVLALFLCFVFLCPDIGNLPNNSVLYIQHPFV